MSGKAAEAPKPLRKAITRDISTEVDSEMPSANTAMIAIPTSSSREARYRLVNEITISRPMMRPIQKSATARLATVLLAPKTSISNFGSQTLMMNSAPM